MTTFFSALTTIVLPILLVTLTGLLLRRTGLIVDSRPMARLALYLLSPALVLDSIARSRLSDSDLIALALFALVSAAVMGLLSLGLARLLRFDRLLTSAFLLSIIFVNAGNIGLPFNQFAYGDAGLSRAAVFFVVNALLTQTLAVFIASSGRREVGDSIAAVFKMPLVYAAALGVLLNRTGWVLPPMIGRAVELTAGAAIPLMLITLGLELARVRLIELAWPVVLATFMKLVATPAVALALAVLMGLRGLTGSVAILEASMPTAVMASIIAVEFDARPDFVTGAATLTTIGSTLTLVVLLLLLGYSPS